LGHDKVSFNYVLLSEITSVILLLTILVVMVSGSLLAKAVSNHTTIKKVYNFARA
jgi:hypothetical protein